MKLFSFSAKDKNKIVGVSVNSFSYDQVVSFVLGWAEVPESRSVLATSVHGVIEADTDLEFRTVLNKADIVTPDGMPLVWMMRLKGEKQQERVYGPELMLRVLDRANREGVSVGFYGGSPEVLERLCELMRSKFNGLRIDYVFSPPFRALSEKEDMYITSQIVASGVRILFVGLGCPKQEKWIDEHIGKIPAVMVGVGAAFDFHAGVKRQAPAWMQKLGLEWLFRLSQEPSRLWRRYLFNNPRFVVLAIADLLGLLMN